MNAVPRNTRQRRAVIDAMADISEFSSAQQVHTIVLEAGQHVGLATVYRTLQALADNNEIDWIHDGEEILYRKCDVRHHHHHLICRHCGAATDIIGPAIEEWADAIAAEHRFVDITHTLEIFGTCSRCAAQNA